eukprot:TRINITY_DN83376_c0_g1_i1.p1 TRINITY_DN83376_c0_g1~~TRINITY_DN83376_c0_g1_i1.p1  ORF type:complete len:369 (+),score=96.22 TRINITY_DN83376_c0_g1_i1:30-1109(+)
MPDLTYDNGDKYSGDIAGGKRNGKGTYYDASGTTFTGTWKDDCLHGMGSYKGEDGTYEGEWEESLKQGKGTFSWATGDRYTGDWYADNMNGTGTYNFANGKVYDGFWRDGQRNGYGILVFPNGNKYEGEWKHDQCDGWGRWSDENGTYEGAWRDNKKHGQGVYTYKDGRKYDGEWVNDKKTRGIVINPDGTKLRVVFNPDGSVLSHEPYDDAPKAPAGGAGGVAPQPPAPKVEPPKSIYPSWLLSAEEQARGPAGKSPVAESFGEPDKFIRGGSTGTIYFQRMKDKFKQEDSKPVEIKVIPYADLKIPSKHNRPEIDQGRRELYLSDAEFRQLFKVEKDAFAQFPQWKRNQMKKKFALF